MMNVIEMNAADAILDRRLKINIPAPWIFRLFGKRTIPIWVKRPVGQTLIRMSRLFVEMDIDIKKLRAGELGSMLECIGKNATTVSRIIAHGMIRGTMASFLLNRPLAWYLRCYMDMRTMAELTKIIVLLTSPEDFMSIITSIATLNLMSPMVSQKKEGS